MVRVRVQVRVRVGDGKSSLIDRTRLLGLEGGERCREGLMARPGVRLSVDPGIELGLTVL